MIIYNEEDKLWAGQVREKIKEKISSQHDRIGSSVPFFAANGQYTDKMADSIYWWTNGFWPGMLWIMYHSTGEEKYLKTARIIEERLDSALAGFEGLHHDVGFMWILTSVLDWRLTGDKTARKRALHAANILAGRYNPRGKFIRAWNLTPGSFADMVSAQNRDCTGWIIVDCMMNLPLLYWASEQLKDPRFAFIAGDHADTALKNLVREDGSCNHIAVLDPNNGMLLETPAGQGYASGSSWTRGLAWALYGFAITFRLSGESRYLEAAKRIARYFCTEVMRYSYIPPVDFRAPLDPQIIDTSAGSIAACGLLTLEEITQGDEAGFFAKEAVSILKAIEVSHCNWDISKDGLVENATSQYHGRINERHVPIIYGDYYFMEAIHRLCGMDLKIW